MNVLDLCKLVAQRLVLALPTVVAVSVIGFFLMRYNLDFGVWTLPDLHHRGRTVTVHVHLKNPIDPLAELKQNPMISPAVIASETQRLGLNQSLPVQYWRWLSHVVGLPALSGVNLPNQPWLATPNLGKTVNGEDVATQLAVRAGNTLLLNVCVIVLTWLLAIPLGVYAAVHWRSKADRLMTLLAAVGMAAPSFVLALIVAVICVRTHWLPVGGLTSVGYEDFTWWHQAWDRLVHLALPVGILTIGGLASLQRQMRGNLLDVLQAEYVRTARAKGLPEHQVIYKHAVRTAINPLITMLGYELAGLLSGSLLVEMVLNYPGLGQWTYNAVLQTDTNVVMASLVMSAVLLVVGNLLADVLLSLADPRIRLEASPS
ncbi:MAG: ABC transporter permease [Vampirovibrionales bacterium]|nr:ABC transporter permease [Vampirovibrionales bacterium]